MTDPEFDSRFSSLPPIDPPDRVVVATLQAIARERARSRWGRIAVVAGGAMAMAAALLIAVNVPAVGEPRSFTHRGIGDVLPTVDLRVVVKSGEEVSRLATGASYHAGDTLLFRVSTSEAMDLTLRRNTAVIWTGHVEAGDHDLPIGYALEAGEGAATFTVEGGGVSQAVAVEAVTR